MTRVLLLGLVLLTAACGGKSIESLCAGQVPPPGACNTPCDPSPGAANTCAPGFHCSPDGKCDAFCTANGNECEDGYVCTADGNCDLDGKGSGSGSGGDVEPDACPEVHATAVKVTPSIQLLIDRSGSMLHDFADNPRNGPTDPDPEKFATEVDALVGPRGVVTQLQGSVLFGAAMYPGATCPGLYPVASEPGAGAGVRKLNNLADIKQLLMAHRPVSTANTPTADSIKLVIADFMAHPAPQGSPPVIVLATDGIPNSCPGSGGKAAEDATVKAAAEAFKRGIRLYLLAVGTRIDSAFKQRLADAGQGIQNARSFTATDPASLAAAFQDIIRGVAPCDLMLSGRVDEATARTGTVTINGTPIAYGTDWMLLDDGITIRLSTNACNMLNAAPDPKVDATFPCGAIIF